MMERIPEPELMTEDEQARAYAQADFEEAHSRFIALFQETFPEAKEGTAVDLGCGPGDITFRFARAHPRMTVHGVDGSEAMLYYGLAVLAEEQDLAQRVQLIRGFLPGAKLPRPVYDVVISNSLLHHLHFPDVLWETVRRLAAPGAPVFVMDLVRPDSVSEAERLVQMYAAGEPEVLRRDFYNSLLAAFSLEEIEKQLERAQLSHLEMKAASDRHVLIAGRA